MIITDCEECNKPLTDEDEGGCCNTCVAKLIWEQEQADKDREFDEMCAMGYE